MKCPGCGIEVVPDNDAATPFGKLWEEHGAVEHTPEHCRERSGINALIGALNAADLACYEPCVSQRGDATECDCGFLEICEALAVVEGKT